MTTIEEWQPTENEDVRVSPEAGPALDTALWRWRDYKQAKTAIDQAHALVELSEAMFALSTWHPDFDNRTGELRLSED